MADEDREQEETDEETKGSKKEPVKESASTRARTAVLKTTTEADFIEERGPAAFVAEFIGTFFLVMFICGAAVLYAPAAIPADPSVPGSVAVQPFQDWTVIGLVHLLSLFLLIQALAVVSGAHFNPAVTAALTAIRQIRPADAGIYVICQLAGGVLGAYVIKLLLENEGDPGYGRPSFDNAVAGDAVGVGFGAELIGTFILVWVIAGVAVSPSGLKDWSGLAIGAPLGVAVMVLGPLSGGSFNPARAFGPAVVGEFGTGAGNWLLVYVVAPVLGALLAGLAYHQMFILPGKKGVRGAEPVG